MRTLHKNKGKGKFIDTHYYTLDVETNGKLAQPESFIFCCLYSRFETLFFYSVEEIKKELLKSKYKKKYIFVHFAEFDLNVIYGNIISELDNAAIYSGSNFISATNGVCIFCDSLNIYRTSVKEIGKNLGIEKLAIENEYLTGEVKEVTEQMKNYCERDCQIVWYALNKIFNFAGSIKKTIASLSLALFKNKYLKYDLNFEPEFTDKFFNSYYGGRTECFKIGKTKAVYYDVNSMYPFCMKKVFPNPKKFKTELNVNIERFKYLLKYYEGIAYVKLFHVEHYFGFLPVKIDGKLMFPCGNFEGWYNFNELRFAFEHNIITFKEVKEVSYATDILESPFCDYVDDLHKLKNASDGIEKINAKLFMNSLYGKFAEKQQVKKVYYDLIPFDLIEQYENTGIKHEVKLFNKDRQDCYIELLEEKNDFKTHVIPMFASYITSYARIRLLEYLLKWQNLTPVYCDTDSIMLENIPNYDDSNVLGDFKREKEIVTEIKGLKNYEYIKDTSDEIFKKLKGVPLKTAKLISENTYQYEKMIKAKSAIRRIKQTGSQEIIIKKISNKYDKRKIIDIFGNTKPFFIKN